MVMANLNIKVDFNNILLKHVLGDSNNNGEGFVNCNIQALVINSTLL